MLLLEDNALATKSQATTGLKLDSMGLEGHPLLLPHTAESEDACWFSSGGCEETQDPDDASFCFPAILMISSGLSLLFIPRGHQTTPEDQRGQGFCLFPLYPTCAC